MFSRVKTLIPLLILVSIGFSYQRAWSQTCWIYVEGPNGDLPEACVGEFAYYTAYTIDDITGEYNTCSQPVSVEGGPANWIDEWGAVHWGAEGTFLVTFECAPGCENEVYFSVGANPTPYPVVGGGTYCTGETVPVGLSYSDNFNQYALYRNGNHHSWKQGLNGPLYWDVTEPGTYTVYSNGCYGFMPMDGSAEVTFTTPPTAFNPVADETLVCDGSSTQVRISTSELGVEYFLRRNDGLFLSMEVGSGGPISWTVTPPSGTWSYTLIAVKGECRRESSSQASVSVISGPTSSYIEGPSIFCTGQSILLEAPSGTGYTYQWFRNGVELEEWDRTLAVSSNGSYEVDVMLNGCSKRSAPHVVTNGMPPLLTITGPSTYCPGSSIALEVPAGYSYQWLRNSAPISGQTSQTLSVSSEGSYQVDVMANGCTTRTDAKVVAEYSLPVTITGSSFFCTGSSTILMAPSGEGYSYQWIQNGSPLSGQTNQSLTVSTAGNYAVQITANGCTKLSDDKLVEERPVPVVTVDGPPDFCSGNFATLTASIPGSADAYQWIRDGVPLTGENASEIYATIAGDYQAQVYSGGCAGVSPVKTLSERVSPDATISGPSSLCSGSTITLTAGSGTGYTYQWRKDGADINGATATTLQVSDGGEYHVAVTANACTASSDTVTVTVGEIPLVTISGQTTICSGNSAELKALSDPGATYQWKKDGIIIQGAISATYLASQAGSYSSIANNGACEGESNSVTVTTIPLSAITDVTGNILPVMYEKTTYSVTSASAVDKFIWQVPADAAISYTTTIQNEAAITFTSAGNQVIKVYAQKDGCTSGVFSKTVNALLPDDSVKIPDGVKISRQGLQLAQSLERQFLFSSVQESDTIDVFQAPPCLEGRYYAGFQLYYDLADLQTLNEWAGNLEITLLRGEDSLWTKSIQVDMITQTFIATIFHDSLISCDDNYYVVVNEKEAMGLAPQENIYFKILLFRDAEDVFSPSAALTLNCTYAGNETVLGWSYAGEGAVAYDIEWVFIEDHENFTGSTPQEAFAYKRAVRITTAGSSYKHLIHYPQGKMWYRARAIGYNPQFPEHRITGHWFYSPCAMITVQNPQADMNWLSQTVYAEEGKYRKVLHYYDGSLRERQVQTNLSTENLTLVGETLYDYEGRASVNILSVPAEDATLTYKTNFNVFQSADPLIAANTSAIKKKFHYDNHRLENSIVSVSSGAGKYYSEANAHATTRRDYIPDADGYVYGQSEYFNEPQSRLSRQSGAGEVFRTDGEHAIRFFDGSVAAEELVRLFGRNVGNASHYKKLLQVDANGQVSITYQDQDRRTIATALAGGSPANVDSLQSLKDLNLTPVTVRINPGNQQVKNTSETVHKILNVTPNTDYTFNYDLSALASEIQENGCQNCAFDLAIIITDPDGTPLDLSLVNGNQSVDGLSYELKNINAASCSVAVETHVQFTVTLSDIGDYTVIKSLVPHELSFEEMAALVQQRESVQETMDQIRDSFVSDPSECEICTDCPEAEAAIAEAIEETTDEECENIYEEIREYYRELYDGEDEEPYEVPEDSIIAHPLYCKYLLCVKNRESVIFEKQLSRMFDWTAAVNAGYANAINIDPFFNSASLSGYNYKSLMQGKLNNVLAATVGGTEYRGTIDQVTDPLNTAFYIDDYGNHDPTSGYHLLYFGLMKNRSQMTEIQYQTELSEQRWLLYRSFYLEAKRRTKLAIPEISNCAGAREELEITDGLPQTEQDIIAWGQANGGYDPVEPATLEMTIYNIENACDISLSVADSTAIAGSLELYFNSNDNNFFKVIKRSDLQVNSHLVAIQNMLNNYGCHLDSVALEDPLQCVSEIEVVMDSLENLVANPTLVKLNLGGCTTDINERCYPGWEAASGTPNTNDNLGGTGLFFIWGYPCHENSEAIRGSFIEPLQPGVEYEVCFKYKAYKDTQHIPPYPGQVDHAYLQLSRSTAFTNGAPTQTSSSFNNPNSSGLLQSNRQASDTLGMMTKATMDGIQMLSTCPWPTAVFPDSVIIQGQSTPVDKLWHGTYFNHFETWQATCVTFIPTEASTYFYFSIRPDNNVLQGVQFKDLIVAKKNSTAICTEYDTANTTIQKFNYTIDWNQEVQKCMANLVAEDSILTEYAIEKLIESEATELYKSYQTRCLERATESFTYSYVSQEYHYTLYYFDQAGNLVQTVPPQGVKPLTPQQVTDFLDNSMIVDPEHALVTNYKFNSLDQLVAQKTPDAGTSGMWYNSKGQIRLSRNAQQKIDSTYSYTRYDELGRVVEAGEIITQQPLATLLSQLDDLTFPDPALYELGDRVRTYYNKANTVMQAWFTQENLRNRVSWMEVTASHHASDTIRTFYSYDIHGNVQSLLQQVPGLDAKRTDYVYDLVSGKVNYVMYQYGKPDQFIHRYAYDSDNRITDVYTSSDGFIWNRDANYSYYLHGPLARTELGEYRVQGLDYYYTLQGWIKGVNMPYSNDPGQDGESSSMVGKDVFAYNLGYYEGDYKSVNNSIAISDSRDLLWDRAEETIQHNGLYNGNISWMVTDLAKIGELASDRTKGMQAMLYRYDQLHRITQARSLTSYSQSTGFAVRDANPAPYDVAYSYDANGNLLTLQRRDHQGSMLHDFNYQYYVGTNMLRSTGPALSDIVYNSGPVVSNTAIYRKITLGGDAYVPAGATVDLRVQEEVVMHPNFNTMEGASLNVIMVGDEDMYQYDAIGNLVLDQYEGVEIAWTPYGKVSEVRAKNDSLVTTYLYDGIGNRIAKKVVRKDTVDVVTDTHYIRDAGGNVMAIYSNTTLIEQPVYGSSRIGQYKGNVIAGRRTLGRKNYELSNHLGNILVVITDNAGMSQDSVWATVINTSDYYPFGMEMEGRTWSDSTTSSFRHGFNGKEKDANFADVVYDYGFRIYNPKTGKFLSVDPLMKDYSELTPYQFSGNNPILFIDLDGLEPAKNDPEYGKNIVLGSEKAVEGTKMPENKIWIGVAINTARDFGKITEIKKDVMDNQKVELKIRTIFIQGHGLIRVKDYVDERGNYTTKITASISSGPLKRDDEDFVLGYGLPGSNATELKATDVLRFIRVKSKLDNGGRLSKAQEAFMSSNNGQFLSQISNLFSDMEQGGSCVFGQCYIGQDEEFIKAFSKLSDGRINIFMSTDDVTGIEYNNIEIFLNRFLGSEDVDGWKVVGPMTDGKVKPVKELQQGNNGNILLGYEKPIIYKR